MEVKAILGDTICCISTSNIPVQYLWSFKKTRQNQPHDRIRGLHTISFSTFLKTDAAIEKIYKLNNQKIIGSSYDCFLENRSIIYGSEEDYYNTKDKSFISIKKTVNVE